MELTLNIMLVIIAIMFIVTPAIAAAEDSNKPVRAFLLGLLIMPSLVVWSTLWVLMIINIPTTNWWSLPLIIALLTLMCAMSVVVFNVIERIIDRR